MGSIGPTPELVEQWQGRLSAARRYRDSTQGDAKKADATFRETIIDATHAGLTAPQIADAVGLSTFRVYQIRNRRRT